MKKAVYVVLFILLGVFVQFLVHALIEVWYIGLLIKDFSKYGLGFSWETWVFIHNIGTVAFFIAGFLIGFWQGRYWWRRIYNR